MPVLIAGSAFVGECCSQLHARAQRVPTLFDRMLEVPA